MTIKIASAQYDIGFFKDWPEYQTKIERWVTEAIAANANILVFPEYACMELASIFGEGVYISLSAQLYALQGFNLARSLCKLQKVNTVIVPISLCRMAVMIFKTSCK
jgi:predicted amidohydrolase